MGEGAGPDRAAAERRFRFELAAHPGSPAQARRLTRARLVGWSVCEDTCDTAALVISELVTNAIVHTASGTVVCELHDGDDLVRIAVRDEGCAPGEPHPSPQRPEEEHGRGLFLVDALCHAWGAQEHGSGLLVWADLARGGEVSHDHGEGRGDFAVSQDDAGCQDEVVSKDEVVSHDSSGSHGDLSGTHGGLTVPRDDLGWGSRPKPGPDGGSRDEDEPAGPSDPDDPADACGPPGPRDHGGRGHRSVEAKGWASIPAPRAHRAAMTDGPLPHVAPQRPHHTETGGGHTPGFPTGHTPGHTPGLPTGPKISPATGLPTGPATDSAWSAAHALANGETPPWLPHSPLRPRPGTGRDLDRDPA